MACAKEASPLAVAAGAVCCGDTSRDLAVVGAADRAPFAPMPPRSQRDLSGYQYSALSSLVLSSGRRSGENEPTGEAESLAGRIDPKAMGSRVVRQPVADVEQKKRKAAESDELGGVRKARSSAPGAGQYLSLIHI